MRLGQTPSARLGRVAPSLAVGIVVAVGLVTVSLVVPYYAGHFSCSAGRVVTSEYNWTPDILLNSPYGGNSSVYFWSPGEHGTVRAENGSTVSVFGMTEWFVYSVDRTRVAGPGSDSGCPSYEVRESANLPPWQQSGGCAGCEILGPGNQTDAREPDQFNISVWSGPGSSGVTSVIYHNGFYSANAPDVSTCGGLSITLRASASWLDLQVPFVSDGHLLFVNVSSPGVFGLNNFTANFSFTFPASFGTWAVDNLSAAGGPGGGWAFDFLGPCK